MPWEDRPEGQRTPLWRCSKNPIIPRDLLPTSNSIFNSAVVPFGEGFSGVFRCDDTNRRMVLHVGFSKDGVNWNINEEPLRFECDNKEIGEWVYGYDPRVCFIEDRYYVTWCNGYHGPTIGIAWTKDFKTFHQLENAFLPYNRNGVLFPEKINGNFAMLSRPSDTGHTPLQRLCLRFRFCSPRPRAALEGYTPFGSVPYLSADSLRVHGRRAKRMLPMC